MTNGKKIERSKAPIIGLVIGRAVMLAGFTLAGFMMFGWLGAVIVGGIELLLTTAFGRGVLEAFFRRVASSNTGYVRGWLCCENG